MRWLRELAEDYRFGLTFLAVLSLFAALSAFFGALILTALDALGVMTATGLNLLLCAGLVAPVVLASASETLGMLIKESAPDLSTRRKDRMMRSIDRDARKQR